MSLGTELSRFCYSNGFGWLPFMMPFTLPLIFMYDLVYFHSYFLIPVTIFLILPILDLLVGVDYYNPTKEETSSDIYKFLLYMWTFTEVALFIATSWYVTVIELTLVEFILIAYSFGIISGAIGNTVAHELHHKYMNKKMRTCGRLLLLVSNYVHFSVEHERGHHKNVATEIDPATSLRNQTIYKFIITSIITGLIHAWILEVQRLSKKFKPIFSVENVMIQGIVLPLCLIIILKIQLGNSAVFFFLAQSLFAILMTESANYIQHYGLLRKKVMKDGNMCLEPVGLNHSWNSYGFMVNHMIFNLPRHSDHHTKSQKNYQELIYIPERPTHPIGYPFMIVMAMFPWVWFKVMNKRVDMVVKSA